MYGTPCPQDEKERCYIRFSTNRKLKKSSGTVLVYCPYGKKSRADRQLLIYNSCRDRDPASAYTPKKVSELRAVPRTKAIDTRAINEAGFYVFRKAGILTAVSISDMETGYRIGKGIYGRMSARGGRFLITSFFPMGDNYRWLAKYDGFDYSDVTFIVTESAKDLPGLLGVKGAVVSRGDLKCLRMYLSMNYHADPRFVMVPYKPLHPGVTFHSDMDTRQLKGIARRCKEPALSAVDPVEGFGEPVRRSGMDLPRSVLLNPYGNSIEARSEAEKKNTFEIMLRLSRLFLDEGYAVYTNTPFIEQKELTGTKRFEGDILTLIKGISAFDLVVSVHTGFMEVVMYTDCNLVVLCFSGRNNRKRMAKSLGHDNYWEIDALKNSPEEVADRIMEVFCGLPGMASDKPVCSTERLLPYKEKAAIFSGQKVTPRLVRTVGSTIGRSEMQVLLQNGTTDPLLCCIGAKAMETGVKSDKNIAGAIKWYRKAVKGGVPWAKRKVIELKKLQAGK